MQEALLPDNETHRLQVLRNLHLLDTPIEERFDRITRMLARTLEMPIASFVLLDEVRFWLKSGYGIDTTEGPRNITFCSHALVAKDDVMVVEDANKDERFVGNPAVSNAPYVTAYAGCSVHAPDGTRIGTLCAVDTKPRQLTIDQIQMLRDMALMVETELRVSMLSQSQGQLIADLESANRMALIDPLTRVWNRKGMDELLAREWANAQRDGTVLSVAIVDIDHFKKINDTHGHPVGDQVLRHVVRQLMSALRSRDIVGRMGGEEFMVIMPNTQRDMLPLVLERLCRSVSQAPAIVKEDAINVTVSIGAATAFPGVGEQTDPAETISHADQALYAAKNDGRNQAKIAKAV